MSAAIRFAPMLSAAYIAGCGLLPPVDVPINPAEVQPWRNTNYGVVSGDAFLRQQGGGVVTCAGSEVFLVPDIEYWRVRIATIRGGRKVTDPPQAIKDVGFKGMCNGKGEFRFERVPEGAWLALSYVTWTVSYVEQGGIVSSPLTVKAGETTTISMNK